MGRLRTYHSVNLLLLCTLIVQGDQMVRQLAVKQLILWIQHQEDQVKPTRTIRSVLL